MVEASLTCFVVLATDATDVFAPAEMNTLMGVKGRDFVLLGGDSAFFRSVVVMDTVGSVWIGSVYMPQMARLYFPRLVLLVVRFS